jgi:hypothetical protein
MTKSSFEVNVSVLKENVGAFLLEQENGRGILDIF